MSLYEIITNEYPELTTKDFLETIVLQDDSDGIGAYIAKWEYSQPIPDGLTLGKPTAQHNLRKVCILKPWLSKAAVQLREQIDDSFPERLRKSDGWIGDARHSARKSDHNPDTNGCVRAIDIDARLSDDKGLSAYLADQIRSFGKTNGRISYVIHQSKIASPILGWRWRKYKGNPHNHHIHVSFKKDQDKNSDFFHIPLLGGNA